MASKKVEVQDCSKNKSQREQKTDRRGRYPPAGTGAEGPFTTHGEGTTTGNEGRLSRS